MFTGIIETIGEIKKFWNGKLEVYIPDLKGIKIGDSISINGMCLTVEDFEKQIFKFHISKESLKISSIEMWREGKKVNVERACTLQTFLGGHLVTGHVDCIGKVKKILKKEKIYISYPEKFSKYLVLKGSISVNGISLTISGLKKNQFEVSIIPFTWENTNLKYIKVGDLVHLEFDYISKLIEKQLKNYESF